MKKIINYVIIIASILTVSFGVFMDLYSKVSMSGVEKILVYVVPMISLFINMIIQIKWSEESNQKEKIKRQTLLLIFAIYILSLSTLLFLGSQYRNTERSMFLVFDLNRVNLIPFKEIINFITNLFKGSSFKSTFINICGNLIAFAPMGFFVPMLFSHKIKTLKHFTLLIILIVFIVELIQFITNIGIADIDDVILNTIGAMIVYILIRTKPIKTILQKLF